MWKSLTKLLPTTILQAENVVQQQLRTTFILRRRVTPFLHKKGFPAKKLRSRHYVYDLVTQTETERQPNIDLILTCYVDGLGNVGDKVSVKPRYGYEHLLIPGLALYPTESNIEKYKNFTSKEEIKQYSSPNALKTLEVLGQMQLGVIMNKDSPWTIEPWHIRASFRKRGFIVPEEAIELPPEPISGPNLDYQNKEFYVIVTINNKEKATVRCRLHHWSSNPMDRLPYVEEFYKAKAEAIIPEHSAILDKLPNPYCS